MHSIHEHYIDDKHLKSLTSSKHRQLVAHEGSLNTSLKKKHTYVNCSVQINVTSFVKQFQISQVKSVFICIVPIHNKLSLDT